MKRVLILGAGTAGTMMANHLVKKVNLHQWKITLVDQCPHHYYQPGFLFIPFGTYTEADVVRPKGEFIPTGVDYLQAQVDRIEAEAQRVVLVSGTPLQYDILIIATGARTAPDQTEGMLGSDWRQKVFDFYTLEGALALRQALSQWRGGRLVVHICEMPIKCPVAPLEFAFLADSWLCEQGLREKTELIYLCNAVARGLYQAHVLSGARSPARGQAHPGRDRVCHRSGGQRESSPGVLGRPGGSL